jgi:intracellular septation protein
MQGLRSLRKDKDIWVNFKLFGGIGLLIAFVIAQGLWLSRYMDAEQS